MGHIEHGHPYIEEKNHASSGTHKSMKLGGGGRFENLTHELSGKPGIYNPAGLAAKIGVAKYGQKRMTKMAVAGKKHG